MAAIYETLLGESRRDRLFAALFWGTVATFTIMVICAWLQVLSRYVFNFPLGWTEELARVMMFWFTFLATGALVRRRRLMMVDAFVSMLPSRGRILLSGVMHLFSALCLGWLLVLSIQLMELASGQKSTALEIPYAYIYLSLPVGLAGAVVYLVAIGIADLRKAAAGDTGGDKRQIRDV
jgi:TRAP-type C4-dicarboxylate transport system permease small subunit